MEYVNRFYEYEQRQGVLYEEHEGSQKFASRSGGLE